MNRDRVWLIKELEVADLKGEKVMVDFQSGKYFLLKGIANDIWNHLCERKIISIEDIVTNIAVEYEIEAKDCRQDILQFLERLEHMGLIQID